MDGLAHNQPGVEKNTEKLKRRSIGEPSVDHCEMLFCGFEFDLECIAPRVAFGLTIFELFNNVLIGVEIWKSLVGS